MFVKPRINNRILKIFNLRRDVFDVTCVGCGSTLGSCKGKGTAKHHDGHAVTVAGLTFTMVALTWMDLTA